MISSVQVTQARKKGEHLGNDNRREMEGVEFDFLSPATLFLVGLRHKVLESSNLKQNCFKLHRDRHFPIGTFQPLDYPCSKSPLLCPVSSSFSGALGLSLPLFGPFVPQAAWDRTHTLWRVHKESTVCKQWSGSVAAGIFEQSCLTDKLWEGKS